MIVIFGPDLSVLFNAFPIRPCHQLRDSGGLSSQKRRICRPLSAATSNLAVCHNRRFPHDWSDFFIFRKKFWVISPCPMALDENIGTDKCGGNQV